MEDARCWKRRQEDGAVGAIIADASLGSRVHISVTDSIITRREGQCNTSSTCQKRFNKNVYGFTGKTKYPVARNRRRVLFDYNRTCLLIISITSGNSQRKVWMLKHEFEPSGIRPSLFVNYSLPKSVGRLLVTICRSVIIGHVGRASWCGKECPLCATKVRFIF